MSEPLQIFVPAIDEEGGMRLYGLPDDGPYLTRYVKLTAWQGLEALYQRTARQLQECRDDKHMAHAKTLSELSICKVTIRELEEKLVAAWGQRDGMRGRIEGFRQLAQNGLLEPWTDEDRAHAVIDVLNKIEDGQR